MSKNRVDRPQFVTYPGASGQGACDLFGMSNAVIVPANNGSSRVLLPGNIGLYDDGSFPKDIDEEIEQLFKNVTAALKAAGLGEKPWQHVYRLRFFAMVGDHFAILEKATAVWKRILGDTKPIITAIPVPGIFHPEAHVELEVEAWLSNGPKL